MESVDSTPRRHIGYHKGSKNQRISHDRSSSCPMYSSPPTIKPKQEKKTFDVIAQIAKTISYLNNPSLLPAKDNHKELNQFKRDNLLRENVYLKTENTKLNVLLSSSLNSNEYEYSVRHSQDSSAYASFNRNVYEPLLKERDSLLHKLKECKRKTIEQGKAPNAKRVYPQRIAVLLEQLKGNLDIYSAHYQRSANENCIDDEGEDNSQKRNKKEHQHYRYSDDNESAYGNLIELNPITNYHFDSNTNITDPPEEEDNNVNIVLTTKKCDREIDRHKGAENQIEICLNEYEINNSSNNSKKTSKPNQKHSYHQPYPSLRHPINDALRKKPRYPFKNIHQKH